MKIIKNLAYLALVNATININGSEFICTMNKLSIIERQNIERGINEYRQDSKLMDQFIENSGDELQSLVKFFKYMKAINKTDTDIYEYKQSLFNNILYSYVWNQQTANCPTNLFKKKQQNNAYISGEIKKFDLQYKAKYGQWANNSDEVAHANENYDYYCTKAIVQK